MQRVPILGILGYNIGSLVASGSTLLVLRQFCTLNRLSSFRPAPPHPLATPLKGGKFDHRPERPKVLLRHWVYCAGRVHSGQRKASVWCVSVRLSVSPTVAAAQQQ